MKKVVYFIIFLFTFSDSFGQEDVQATCKSNGLKVEAWVKATTAQVTFPNSGTNNQIAMIMVFSLPANGATNTMNAPVPIAVSSPVFPTISFLHYDIAIANDRFIYTYYNNPTGVATQTPWAIGQEKLLMQLEFGPTATGIFPRLDNLWNSGGGPNFFDYFYFEVNSNQRSNTFGDPFYNGLEGTYPSTDQYVQATAPLPIRLISFDVEKDGERSAYLSWSSSSEINSSHFEIQRSFDKKVWNNIGIVAAAGNSQIVQQYNFYDDNVYNGKDVSLNVYYRLKMVDIDERSEFSPMESVTFGKATYVGKDILAYPNPASDGIQVEWDASQVDQPTAIEIYDIAGKLIYQTKVADQTNQYYIDFGPTNIQTGLHLMRIMHGDVAIEHKQIVVSRN